MDLAKLEMFVRVAELGSLSKASIHYNLGASALSRQLAAIEAEFHGRLLHRTGHGVRLTELGREILPKAIALIAQARSLKAEVDTATSIPRGTVHVACQTAFAAPLMTRVVKLAREKFPEVVVHVAEGMSGQIEQWLADGTVDIGFVLRKSAGATSDRLLARSRLCLVGPAGDRLTLRKEVEFKLLDGLPLLQPALPNAFRQMIADIARKHGVRLNVVAEVDSFPLTKDMVAAGIGYGILSAAGVMQELKTGRLSATRIVNPEIKGSIYLSTPARKPASLAAREVLRLVRQVAEDLPNAAGWGE